MTPDLLLWSAISLAAAGVAVRSRRPPVQWPLPTALAGGAAVGLLAALLGLGWLAQTGLAVATAAGLGGLLWRWRILMAQDNLDPGVGGNRQIGRVGTVVVQTRPDTPLGVVRLGGETWRATAGAGTPLHEGQVVTVVAVEGIHLVVEPATVPDTGGAMCD